MSRRPAGGARSSIRPPHDAGDPTRLAPRPATGGVPRVPAPSRPSRGVPWQIWIVVLFLGLEGVGNLLSIPQEPAAARWLAAKCLFITGLICGWRWVFVLFLAVAGVHVLAFSTQ